MEAVAESTDARVADARAAVPEPEAAARAEAALPPCPFPAPPTLEEEVRAGLVWAANNKHVE